MMTVPPEAQLLIINATILAVAYLGIYPAVKNITMTLMMALDAVLSGLSLIVAGALYWGSGVEFSLLLFSTNWAVFAIVTMLVMEFPLFQ
ncbi:MAG: hypothetical protein ACKPKD_00385 [Microcystis panniformis]